MNVIKLYSFIFSELKAKVNIISDHLLSVVYLSGCLFVRSPVSKLSRSFHLLFKDHAANFSLTLHTEFLSKG